MSLLLAVSMMAAREPSPMERFFPATPGIKRRYLSERDRVEKTETSEEVMAPVRVGDQEAFSVQTYSAGKRSGLTYYRFEGDALKIVGFDPKNPLDPPRIVAKSTPSKWSYEGSEGGAKLVYEAESKLGRRKVEGKDREILIVVIEAKIDEGVFQNTVKQTSTYAEGIGLIEMREEQRTARTKWDRVVKLIKFEAPKSEGGN